MLPRISSLSLPSLPLSLSDAPSAAGAKAGATLEASRPAPVAPSAGIDEVMCEAPAADAAWHAHADSEAAAARQFWLPADAWSSIGEFLPREDVLSLRTLSREMRTLADESIQHLKIPPEALPDFIDSDSFKSVTTLDVSLLDRAALGVLTAHLAAHPRPEMTLHLDARRTGVDTATLAGLSTLSLGGLVLKLHSATSDELDALAACGYPLDLTPGHITRAALIAASNMPTLRRLVASATAMNEQIANRFATHGTLEVLTIRTGAMTSAQTLQALASIPTLREFYINGRDSPDLDVATARVLADNASLEDLKIISNGQGLDEDGYAALSQSRSLRTLLVPLRATMLELTGMTSLTTLIFGGCNSFPYATLDAATARSIAALPALDIIAFPIMNRESNALTAILRDGTASRLDFSWVTAWGNDDFFSVDERTALMANNRLKVVKCHQGALHGLDRDAVLNHPTIEYVKSGGREYTRGPDSNVTLTLRHA